MCSCPSRQSLWRLPKEPLLLSDVELGRDIFILFGVRTASGPNDSRLCTRKTEEITYNCGVGLRSCTQTASRLSRASMQ